jgi:hypothetical protein
MFSHPNRNLEGMRGNPATAAFGIFLKYFKSAFYEIGLGEASERRTKQIGQRIAPMGSMTGLPK